MAEVTTSRKSKRRPWLAIMLSLIVPGLGHIYCGKIVRGLGLAFLLYLSPLQEVFFRILLLAYFAIWLIPAIDSYLIAKHTKSDYELKDYNRLLVYILWAVISTESTTIGALHFREKFLEAFRVPVASKDRDPQRGDLIVFINPEDRRINYIKRIVAIAGDTVETKNSELYINDRKLQRRQLPDFNLDRIRVEIHGELLKGNVYEEINGNAKYNIFLAQPPHNNTSADAAKITVPKYQCFVLGDNRNLSHDSRHFGPIPLATIIGRADFLYCPAQDWSRFGSLSSD